MDSDSFSKRVELNLSKMHSFCEIIVADLAFPVKYAISPKHSPFSITATVVSPLITAT